MVDAAQGLLWLKAAVMGVVEGLTEFLPISSTGHLILAGTLMGLTDETAKVFDVANLGHSAQARRFAANVLIGFLPAALVGLLAYKTIKTHLFNAPTVAGAFIVGGLIILWVERARPTARIQEVEDMSWLDALKVGLVQCLGMIPGTSRSGATIIGGMALGLSRKAATDFSFFLAIPTLVGAGAYSLYKEWALLSWQDAPMFAIGLVCSFISAWVCVRWLLRYIASHSFVPFAWYRIAFGVAVLLTAYSGVVDWHG